MTSSLHSRRNVLKQLGAVGAGLALSRDVLRCQAKPIVVNGTPVEIIVSSLGPSTVRVSVVPIAGLGPHEPQRSGRLPTPDARRTRANPVACQC